MQNYNSMFTVAWEVCNGMLQAKKGQQQKKAKQASNIVKT
jgi:hypothetical protein